jgi:hypothetical protein
MFEKYAERYTNGEISYYDFIRPFETFFLNKDSTWRIRNSYIFKTLPTLKQKNENFRVFFFDDINLICEDILHAETMLSVFKDISKSNILKFNNLLELQKEWVEIERRRDEVFIRNINAEIENIEPKALENTDILTGYVHSIRLFKELRKKYPVEIHNVDPDLVVTPESEYHIRLLKGEERSRETVEEMLLKEAQFLRDAQSCIPEHTLRNRQFIEKHKLKSFSELIEDLV